MNIADMRTVHSREAFASLKEHFEDKVFDTVIRSSIAYAESAERGRLDPRPPARPRRRLPRAGRRGARPHRPRRAAAQAQADARRRRARELACAARRSPPPCSPPPPRAAAGRRPPSRRSPPRSAPRSGPPQTATPAATSARRDGRPTARVVARTFLRATPDGRRLRRVGTRTEFGSPRVLSVVGERDGWLKVLAAELPNDRRAGSPRRGRARAPRSSRSRIDRSRRQLRLLRDGRTVRRVTIAVGRPDTPTPTGRFAVTDKLRTGSPDSPYGCCALALTGHQTKLLAGWPGGDRLAVHGTPQPETVGKPVSLGCMRAHRRDMRALMRAVPLGAPVTIRRLAARLHGGAVRLERHDAARRPSPAARARRRATTPGRGARVRPHEHGGPGAGDRRAERPELRRALHDLHRARVQVTRGAAGGGGPRARGRRGRGRRSRARARAARAWATLKTASAIGTSAGSAARASRGAHRAWGTTSTASSPAGRRSASPGRRRRATKPAVAGRPRRCPDAPRARSRARAGRRRARRERVGGDERRRRSPRRSCPSPPASGIAGADAELEAARRAAGARTRARTGCAGRGRSRGRCRTPNAPVSTTSTSTCSAERGSRARRSPAPGSPTRRGRGRAGGAPLAEHGALDRGELRLAGHDRIRRARAPSAGP